MITISFEKELSKKPTKAMTQYALFLGLRGGAVAAMNFDECSAAIDKQKRELKIFFADGGKSALGCKSQDPHQPKKGTNKPGQSRPER